MKNINILSVRTVRRISFYFIKLLSTNCQFERVDRFSFSSIQQVGFSVTWTFLSHQATTRHNTALDVSIITVFYENTTSVRSCLKNATVAKTDNMLHHHKITLLMANMSKIKVVFWHQIHWTEAYSHLWTSRSFTCLLLTTHSCDYQFPIWYEIWSLFHLSYRDNNYHLPGVSFQFSCLSYFLP